MLQTFPSRRTDSARPASPATGAYKVDISRGERIGRVSSEWFSRPDDERYLSLGALHAAVRARAERATARTVETKALRVEASRDNAEHLTLIVPGHDTPVVPTHWSYGQLCSLVGAPASYMRQLPAPLAGINLQHGLLSHRAELVKTLEADDGRIELRAVTGPDYGRIWDHELVEAVMRIAGDGTGDTRWKVPGLLDWSTMTHNPFVEVTKDTTTLYASDRDVFLFLVDDAHPIEAGRLPNGDPDLYFRGFYCWNSEVGSKTLGMASYRYYTCCTKARQGKTGCKGRTIPTDRLDAIVIEHIENRLLAPDRVVELLNGVLERRTKQADDYRESIARLRRQAADADAKLTRLYDAIENGLADTGDENLKGRLKELRTVRDAARSDADRAEARAGDRSSDITEDAIRHFAGEAKRRMRTADGGYRRHHLQALAQRIEVGDGTIPNHRHEIEAAEGSCVRRSRPALSRGGPLLPKREPRSGNDGEPSSHFRSEMAP